MSCEYCKIEPYYFEGVLFGEKGKEYINYYKIARIFKVRDGFELQCAELSCGSCDNDVIGAWKSIKITHCPWCGEKLGVAENHNDEVDEQAIEKLLLDFAAESRSIEIANAYPNPNNPHPHDYEGEMKKLVSEYIDKLNKLH